MDVLLVPTAGALITVLGLVAWWFIVCFQARHGAYEEIETPPPHIYNAADMAPLCARYKKATDDLKKLQNEGLHAREFLNRMKRLATVVDPRAKDLEDENEVFESAKEVFTELSTSKRESENRARCEKSFGNKLARSQMKILQMLPGEIFTANGRLFLTPSPLNRVCILVYYLTKLRGVHEKAINKGKLDFRRGRHMTPSQLRHYMKNSKEGKIQETLREAKKRLRATGNERSQINAGTVLSCDERFF